MMTMRRKLGRGVALGCVGAACAVGGGCTLVNAYDEVAPLKVTLMDGSSEIDSSVSGEAGSDAEGGGGSPDAGIHDAAAEEAAAIAAAHGAIVIGGEATGDAGRQLILTALDPSTGSELPKARKPLTVSAVQYDGERDLWYVFESGGQGISAPTDPFYLHTFTLDTITGQWTELGKFQIPTGVSFATTTVVLRRLAYVAYGDGLVDGGVPAEGGAPYSLVTLDTSDPTAVKPLGDPIPLAGGYGALVGTPSEINAAARVSRPRLDAQDSRRRELLEPHARPRARGRFALGRGPHPRDVARGHPRGIRDGHDWGGWRHAGPRHHATQRDRGAGYSLGLRSAANDPTMALTGAGTFTFGDSNVKPPAFAPCAQVALVVGTNSDLSVHAVSIGRNRTGQRRRLSGVADGHRGDGALRAGGVLRAVHEHGADAVQPGRQLRPHRVHPRRHAAGPDARPAAAAPLGAPLRSSAQLRRHEVALPGRLRAGWRQLITSGERGTGRDEGKEP